MLDSEPVSKTQQTDANLFKMNRSVFWKFCLSAAIRAQDRSDLWGLPCDIDAHYLDSLLVDQDWSCAVTGMPLHSPDGKRKPFGPSVDRINSQIGYIRGNVRIVCNMVNLAMSEWGEKPLWELIEYIRRHND